MNKVFAFIVMAVAASFCFGESSSFCIGTEGVDCYADGTPVMKGERYGLVLVKKGKTFAGVKSDGTLVDPVNNALQLVVLEANSESRLPICSYTADATFAGGTAHLVIFDTRTPDGGVNGPIVNGWGVAASVVLPASSSSSAAANRTTTESAFASASNGSSARVAHSSPLPASVPAGVIIEKMEFDGDDVVLTVRNTGSAAYYAAAGAEDLTSGDFETEGVSTAVRGAVAADGTITVRYPKSAKGRFFKVKGGTLMDL